jgi:hypothetical protein
MTTFAQQAQNRQPLSAAQTATLNGASWAVATSVSTSIRDIVIEFVDPEYGIIVGALVTTTVTLMFALLLAFTTVMCCRALQPVATTAVTVKRFTESRHRRSV